MIARKSFLERSSQRISRLSSTSRLDSLINEKEWESTFLRRECKLLGLEKYYRAYMRNLRASYLKLLIVIELLVVGVHCVALLSTISRECKLLGLEKYYRAYMRNLRASYLKLLIVIELLVVGVHCVALLSTISDLNNIAADILAYVISALLVWGILALNFNENLVQRYPWIIYVTSYSAIAILALVDVCVTVYHVVSSWDPIAPFLDSYILYAIYMFMPLPSKIHVLILGMSVTVLYLFCYAFVTYRQLSHVANSRQVCKVLSEGIFLLSINILGIYFRFMRENAIRITFLDRRKYVEESLLLRYAREEEQRLLLNIIPEHIVHKIEHHVKSRLQHEMTKKRFTPWRLCRRREMQTKISPQAEHEKLFIEPHDNVTILYADLVNYTQLTTSLDVKTLVETLHDLFVKFDTASKEFNVLRIKFLGDCYYAVAGVPTPNEHNAKCCVELGLRMITIIHDVKTRRNLDIDMRIGIHTGSILSGVIGTRKIQYDIWSKDVDIASRLEQTGIAGRVHVSEDTLKQLGDNYMYEQGTREATIDPVLKDFGIITFLIKEPRYPAYNRQTSSLAEVTRHTVEHVKADSTANFMQGNAPQLLEMQMQVEEALIQELEKMPVAKLHVPTCCFDRLKPATVNESDEDQEDDVTSMCLFYEDWHCELQFLIESDDMLKYNVFVGVIIFASITAMSLVNQVQSEIFLTSSIIFSVILLTFLFLVWFKKLWIMFFAEHLHSVPVNGLISFLFNVSKNIQTQISARIAIYLLIIIIIHFAATFIQLLDCTEENTIQKYARRRDGELCFNPWGITESLELTICMMFLFSRIPFILKLAVGVLISVTYSIVIFVNYPMIFEAGPSTTVALQAKYSHIMVVVITFVIFYLMDRQTEFISKMDYTLKRQLLRKQEDAEMTNAYITMLINNILPSHVADIYTSRQMQSELYYEEHDNVAVMFASIKNYNIERVGLAALNEIISGFDEVIKFFETEGMFKVEKIKVAGWNYMAACGLGLAHSDKADIEETVKGPVLQHNGTGTNNVADNRDPSSSKKTKRLSINIPEGYVVYVMARFAVDLMKTMHGFNVEHQHCQDEGPGYGMLRIGISHGPVMAGVIGSSKPHYDIWGDCVNMASRMSITGLPGRIQVTENAAEILHTFHIQCDSRGMTYVKGRGEIPTYFIGVDENFNFIQEPKTTTDATQNDKS